MGSKSELILLMFPLVCCVIFPPAALQPAVAQEETSLGENENFARGIVSDVLDSGGNAEEDESNQDAATNTANEDSNQAQEVDQDDVSTLGDDSADLDDANVAAPIAVPINVQLEEEEESECPPGFTLNGNGQCERIITQDPTCPSTLFPLTFNPETDLCEATDEPFCPEAGFTYNRDTNLCQSGTEIGDGPICLVGSLDTETDLCEASTPPTCAEGFTFNTETDLCEQRQTQPPT